MARERFEHEILKGFEGTAEERRRLLGRHIFTDKDVEDVRGEYEGCWQQIESEQDKRRRQAREDRVREGGGQKGGAGQPALTAAVYSMTRAKR